MEPAYMMEKRKICWVRWKRRNKTKQKEKLGKYRRIFSDIFRGCAICKYSHFTPRLQETRCRRNFERRTKCPVESKPKVNVCNVATVNNNRP